MKSSPCRRWSGLGKIVIATALLAAGFPRAIAQTVPLTPAERKEAFVLAKQEALRARWRDGTFVMGSVRGVGAGFNPYFACLAASCLVQAAPNPTNVNAGWELAGFIDRMRNPDGTSDDLTWTKSGWTLWKRGDSTDAYAASYLILVDALHRADPDIGRLSACRTGMDASINVVYRTLQTTGPTKWLTTAKPGYGFVLTMDAVETIGGLRAASHLLSDLGDGERAVELSNVATKARSQFKRLLYDGSRHLYRWNVDLQGNGPSTGSGWYPDQMANLMAIAWLPSSRTAISYAAMKAAYAGGLPPTCNTESDVDRYCWWGFAAAAAGDTEIFNRVQRGLYDYLRGGADLNNVALLGMMVRILSVGKAIPLLLTPEE